jgi:N-acetyl-anhydromuramyl-L-alanine amidase AmpD
MSAKMVTHGKYAKGWPVGAIVHFTAGRDGAEKTINGGIQNGYAYWCIQKDGKLFCAHPANEWGYHAGESAWKNPKFLKPLLGSVSDDLIGIEINAAGRLTKKGDKFYSWFNTEIPAANVRYCDGSSPDQCEGYYEKYTPEQEATLIATLLWLKAQAPDVFTFDDVLGHCEVSGKLGIGYFRKNDPSAALSMTMPQFRQLLKDKWTAMQK